MKIFELSIQCWNISGIFTNINGFKYNKLDNPLFHEHITRHLIFGLIETQHTSDDTDKLQILNYKCYQACRKKLKQARAELCQAQVKLWLAKVGVVFHLISKVEVVFHLPKS